MNNKNDILFFYKDKPIELLNKIFEDEAKSKYELITNYMKCSADVIGYKYIHEINTIKYFSEGLEYLEAHSAGKMAPLAEKFIHRFKNQIEQISTDKIENYSSAQPTFLDYNTYISKHGKLFTRKYFSVKKIPHSGELFRDEFLTFDEKEFLKSDERNKHVVYSTVAYQFNEGNILEYKFEKENDIYKIRLKLDPLYSNDFYSLEVIYRGALFDMPKFTKTELEFELDKNLNLLQIKSIDEFFAKSGIISSTVTVETFLKFYHSEDNSFNINNKIIKINLPKKLDGKFTFFPLLNN